MLCLVQALCYHHLIGGLVAIGPYCAGSEIVSKLATKVRPRYHICGGKDIFYARQPYLNKDLGAGGNPSRLILLALYLSPLPKQWRSAYHQCAWGVTSMLGEVKPLLSIQAHKARYHSTALASQPCPRLDVQALAL